MNEKIRPKGKWIKKSNWSYVCSLCGCDMMDEYNYCPDCGAEMKQERELSTFNEQSTDNLGRFCREAWGGRHQLITNGNIRL